MILLDGRGEGNDRRKNLQDNFIKAHGRGLSKKDGAASIISSNCMPIFYPHKSLLSSILLSQNFVHFLGKVV